MSVILYSEDDVKYNEWKSDKQANLKNFSGGTIGGLRLDFAGFQGVGGGLCLTAQGFPAPLLLPSWAFIRPVVCFYWLYRFDTY